MSDVARAAGVSLKTVSRVVDRETRVTAATSERVRAAIDSLGFRRNEAARALRQGRVSQTPERLAGSNGRAKSVVLPTTLVPRGSREIGS